MRRRTSETNVPPYAFTSTADLKTAVQAYKNDSAAAVATYGPIADWDVSAITDMWGLFYKIDNFNANISNWDTSRVTDMNSMFRVHVARALCSDSSRPFPSTLHARPLHAPSTSPPPIPAWRPARIVCPPSDSWQQARSFNQPLSFNTSSVTDMQKMFKVHSACALCTHTVVEPFRPCTLHTRCMRGHRSTDLPASHYLLSDRQGRTGDHSVFNQPLLFDTSSVTNMFEMFEVHSARALRPGSSRAFT